MAGPWEKYGGGSKKPWVSYGGSDDEEPSPKPAGVIRKLADFGLSGAKSLVSVPESAVGLADIATGGRAGQMAENAGIRFKDAHDVLSSWQSDDLKGKQQEFSQADGVISKLSVALRNPSLIANAVAESAGPMLAGGAVARGISGLAKGVSPLMAGAAGEGIVGAGSAAEGIRQETADGRLTPTQVGLSAASGAATAGFGMLGGLAARKMGIGDVDTMLAGGTRQVAAEQPKGLIRRIAEGVASESLLEEVPQSISEQVLQNIALDRPIDEGVTDAAVMGGLAGGAMGGAAAGISRPRGPLEAAAFTAPDVQQNQPQTPEGIAPDAAQTVAGEPAEPAGNGPVAHGAEPATDPNVQDVVPRMPTGPLSDAATIAPPVPNGVDAETGEVMAEADKSGEAPPAKASEAEKPRAEAASFASYDEASGFIKAQKQRGTTVQALPVPREDGTFGLAQKGGPDYPVAEAHQKKRALTERGVKDGDILAKSGEPFKVRLGAIQAHKKAGVDNHHIAQVKEGFVVRPGKLEEPLGDLKAKPEASQPLPIPNNEQDATNAAAEQASNVQDQAPRTPGQAEPAQDQAGEAAPGDVAGTPAEPAAAGPAAVEAVGVEPAKAPPNRTAYVAEVRRQLGDLQPGDVLENDMGDKWTVDVVMRNKAGEVTGFLPREGNPETGEREMLDLDAAGSVLLPTPYLDASGNRKLSQPGKVNRAQPATPAEPQTEVPAEGAAAVEAAGVSQSELERIDAEERIAKPALRKRIAEGKEPKYEWNTQENIYAAKASDAVVEGDASAYKIKLTLTPDEKRAVKRADADMTLADTPEERAAARKSLTDAFRPAVDRALAEKSTATPAAPTPKTGDTITVDAKPADTQRITTDKAEMRPYRKPDGSVGYEAVPISPPTPASAPAAPAVAGPAKVEATGVADPMAQKRQKAIDRIAKGTAYFSNKSKASDYIKANGLEDTHEAVQSPVVANRWDVAAKALPAKNAKPQETTAEWSDRLKADNKPFMDKMAAEDAKDAGYKAPAAKNADGQQDEMDAEMRSYEAKANPTYSGEPAKPAASTTPASRNAVAARDLLAEYTKAVRDGEGQKALAAIKKRAQTLASNTPATDEAAVLALDILATRMDAESFTFADAPAPQQAPTPAAKPDPLTEQEKAAKAKMLGAAAKLAELLSKNTRANITPEQEQKMLPIVIELFEGAMDLGYVKFKQAARYVREFLADAIDQDAADSIPIDTLQGAYIATARRHSDKNITPKKDVISVETLADLEDEASDQLEQPAEKADTAAKDKPNEPTNPSQQDPQALDGVPASKDGGTESSGRVGRGGTGRGSRSKKVDPGLAEPGVSGTRSGGSGSTSVRAPTARKPRGRRLGGEGTGANGNGLSEERSPVPVDLFNQPTAPVSAGNIQASNFRITENVRLGQGGEAEKFRDNLAAIKTLKAIESEGRRATSDEQRTLARYVGWGGLANAFPNPETKEWKDDWKARGAELKDLLTQKEYDLARRSTLDSHYTSQTIVTAMWDAARRLGFNGGLAAETSMGIGNFIGLMPESVAGNTRFIGVEYDSLTARMAGLLYPQSTVLNSGLQHVPLPDNAFDLNIGNPPFGDQSLRFQFKPEFNRVSIHNQFFLAGVDSLKPGGLQLNVVSRYLLDAMDKTTRTMLAKKVKLIAAIRLPDTAFKENARTSVVTDIVILQRLTPAEETTMQAAFEAANSKPDKDFKAEAERRALAAKVPSWVEVAKMADPLGGDAMTVSNYFVENPDMILGTLERSGKMQFKNDITVRPGSTDLSQLLSQAVAKLPEGILDRTQEAIDESIARHKTMGDAIKIALSGQEAGSIVLNPDGVLEQVFERETPEGNYELAKRPLTAESPWSETLFQDAKGQWFTVEAKLDDEGKKLKVMKDGAPTKLNVYERVVYKTEAEIPSSKRIGEADLNRLTKLVKLRDLMVKQINLETEDAPKIRMEGNRTRLREAYEAFVAEDGFISKPTNSALVANMPDGALVQALELGYRKAITLAQAKRSGEKPRRDQADPAPILTERVIPKYEPPTSAASPADALSIVLSETGRVDITRMASLLGKTEENVTAEMFDQSDKPLIFKDPETGQWVTRNDYLTGQVKKKLHAAQAAGIDKNIRELEAVLPEPWGAENVTVILGANFVPPQIYADFVQHVTGRPAKVSFSQATNSYQVNGQPATTEKQDEFGAEGITIASMVSDMLNSTAIKVMTKNADGNSVIDQELTALAILKGRQIASEFTDWAFAESARRKMLVELFNEKYNTRVNRQHDGAHLTLPGKVPDAILSMRRHQKNTIWRGISERFMLIDHVVGAGKTFTAIARAMERRRMGLSRKPAIIVPNHMVEQFKADVYRLYPGAKVLAAGKKDFEKARRRKIFAKVASGDWDIVIISHSSFGFIGIAPETEERYLEQELVAAEAAIKEAWESSDEGEGGYRKPFNVKQAERLRDKITARMERLKGDKSKDRLLTFEQMGIDDLTVDEAHEFKNLFYSTSLTGVKGMGNPTGSQKAFDLYTKVRVLRETPTGSVTFMTGTPISNSAVEMFNMMRYLAADDLKELGLEHFDAWRAQFVSTDSGWEHTETGRLKEVNRLGRSWSNMRSLMDLYYSFTDSVGNDDIKRAYAEDNAGKEFPIPKVKGGDRQSVVVKPTREQIEVLEQTIADFDSLPSIEDPYERNIERLRLMDRARKVSLDVRAAVRGHPSKEVGGKLEQISAQVKRIYDKWTPEKGTQLIFLDRSVPKSKGDATILKEYDALVAERNSALAVEDEDALRKASDKLEKFDAEEMDALRAAQAGGWNAYQQIKDNLIASGIPAGEIRFIQEATNDAQKRALFDQVKAGEVRVLIGSTPRMGAGTNVQDRLVALHHADVTWKPSDIEQREGRIIRQGNRIGFDADGNVIRPEFEVEILAYATERTIDAKMWNLNSAKLKTINAIRKYDGSFTMDFDDDDSVSMAELAALASGNPLLLERVKLEGEINNLELLRKQHQRKTWGYKGRLEDAENAIKRAGPDTARYEKLAKQAAQAAADVAEDVAARFVIVEGERFSDLADASKAVVESIKQQQAGVENAKFSIKVGERRLTSQAGALDAVSDELGDSTPFLAEVHGVTYRGRTALARELAGKASEAAETMTGNSRVLATGKVMGFNFEAFVTSSSYRGFSVDLVLSGEDGKTITSVETTPQQNPKFMTSMLTGPLGRLDGGINASSFESNARFTQQAAERAKREIPELREKAALPFAKDGELKEKKDRLAQVIRELSSDPAPDSEQTADYGMPNRAQTGAFEGNDTDEVFSRSPTQGRMLVSSAQAAVDQITAKWKSGPTVKVVQSYLDLPVKAPRDVKGMYYKGVAYVVALRHRSAQDVGRTLAHEVIAHHGLRNMLGRDDWMKLMKQVQFAIKAGNKPMAALRDTVRERYVNEDGTYTLSPNIEADEIIALGIESAVDENGEFKPGYGMFKAVWAKIAMFLRDMGINIKFTNAELQGMLVLAQRELETGKKAEGGGEVLVAASRGEDAQASRGTNEPVTKSNDVVGNQGGRSADDISPGAAKRNALLTQDEFDRALAFVKEVESLAEKHGAVYVRWSASEKHDLSADAKSRDYGSGEIHAGLSSQKIDADMHPVTIARRIAEYNFVRGFGNNKGAYPRIYTADEVGTDSDNAVSITNLKKVIDVPKSFVAAIDKKFHDAYDYKDSLDTWEKRGNNELVSEYTKKLRSVLENESPAPTNDGAPERVDQTDPDIRYSRGPDALAETLSKITVTDVRKRAGNRIADYRSIGLQMLGRRQLVDIYSKDLPTLDEYSNLVQQMEADKNETGALADEIAQNWGKLKDDRPLAEMMHDATVAQIDPSKPHVPGDNRMQYGTLRARWDALSPEARKVYQQARDAYEEHYSRVREEIRNRIERSGMSATAKGRLLERMDGEFFEKIKGVYFPLARFGKFVVVTRDNTGKVVDVGRAETMNEAQALRSQLLNTYPSAKGYNVGKVIKDKEFNAARDAVGRGFLKQLFGVLDQEGVGGELQDAVNQLYLQSMPDLSWAKHGIHRKGTPGFSQDARRAFAQNMFHGARYLAKLRYADQLQTKLDGMQEHVDANAQVEGFDQPKAQDVVDEMVKRHDSLMNPKTNSLSTALTSFGFVFHLGMSPASALVNLSQTALVAYPVMAAKWGYDKAGTALLKAGREAAVNGNDIGKALTGDERRAYEEAVRAGTIDVTMAHDLAGISQGEDAKVTWALRPVMRWASFMFHHAERFNRQVTFVAAYRLAREAGSDHESATAQATRATYDGHFDYAAANRPRIMQGNAAKVLLLFKQFGQNMVYTIARQAQQSIKGETPQARREARRALGGLLAMHAAGAGLLGLPLVTTLLGAASMLGGSDDEPWDAEVALRNMLTDAFGAKPAEVMARGFSRLTPWDISGRVGLDRLILPDVQEGLEGQRLGESAMAAALGPVAGIGVNVLKGLQEMGDGNYARGLETMMPSALRGPMRALRYADEGAQDRTGVSIVDEVSVSGIVGQALGLSPSDVRLASEAKGAVLSADRRVSERRSALLAKYSRAVLAGDDPSEVREEIDAFNAANPGRRIGAMHMQASVRARNRRIAGAEGGVYLPRNRTDAREAGRFGQME